MKTTFTQVDEIRLSDSEIEKRYRRTYGLGRHIGIKEAMAHWSIERYLTERLLGSTPDNRWEIFVQCYSELYFKLPWLNETPEHDALSSAFDQWGKLLPQSSLIFEVGSGKAQLLRYLHSLGHSCVATEITHLRGSKHAATADGLQWHTTDGIHLADFEPAESYDVIISTEVIEHFHPDDIQIHFEHAKRILKSGGRYIFTTPHVGSGPHDLSSVFGFDTPVCMHLREYNYVTLADLLRKSGFCTVQAIFPPSRVYRKLGFTFASTRYFSYLMALDHIDERLSQRTRRRIRTLLKFIGVPTNIWISAQRP